MWPARLRGSVAVARGEWVRERRQPGRHPLVPPLRGATCGCTAALALAAGLGVDRSAFVPLPVFFTDLSWYGETGWAQFRRPGTVLLAATVAAGPAFVGTHPAAYERAAAMGIPVPATRSGALLTGALSAAAVARIAFGVAVERYEEYRFE